MKCNTSASLKYGTPTLKTTAQPKPKKTNIRVSMMKPKKTNTIKRKK